MAAMFSLDRHKNDTSVMLDLLRAVAAQAVCIGHAVNFFMWQWRPTHFPLMQNVGVLLFFILSGFLIAHTLAQRSDDPSYSFGHFVIDRFARIYSGLLPALAFVLMLDSIIGQRDRLLTLFANVLMNEGYRGIFPNALPREAFGSAPQLWTLAVEWHIYLFVGAAFFILKRRGTLWILIPALLFFGQTPVRYIVGGYQRDGIGEGLFSLWLGGALLYFAAGRLKLSRWLALTLTCIGTAAFIQMTTPGAEYNLFAYPCLLCAFFGLVMLTQQINMMAPFAGTIRFFADYSFSLYLSHHTVMYAIATTWPESGAAGLLWSIVLSNCVGVALAYVGEKHHKQISRFLLTALRTRAVKALNKPHTLACSQHMVVETTPDT